MTLSCKARRVPRLAWEIWRRMSLGLASWHGDERLIRLKTWNFRKQKLELQRLRKSKLQPERLRKRLEKGSVNFSVFFWTFEFQVWEELSGEILWGLGMGVNSALNTLISQSKGGDPRAGDQDMRQPRRDIKIPMQIHTTGFMTFIL